MLNTMFANAETFISDRFAQSNMHTTRLGVTTLARQLVHGSSEFLHDFKLHNPDTDVITLDLPKPAQQSVYVAVSSEASRVFAGMLQDGIDRHAKVSGSDTSAARIFGGDSNGTVGLLLSPTTAETRAVNTAMRTAMNSLQHQPADIVEEIVDRSKMSGAYDACLATIGSLLVPEFMDGAKDPAAEVSQASTRLEAAAVSIFLRTNNVAQYAIGHIFGDKHRLVTPVGGDFTRSDATSAVAAIQATVSATYWSLVRQQHFPHTSAKDIAHEVLRFDASPVLNVPRADRTQIKPSQIVTASPIAIMAGKDFGDNATQFDPQRFSEADLYAKVCRTAFGMGSHHCPSSNSTPAFLAGVIDAARVQNVQFSGRPKTNIAHFIVKQPTRRTQGKFIVA